MSGSSTARGHLGAKVKCICGATDDDGEAMTECDNCSTWLHNACVGLPPDGPDSDSWLCSACSLSGKQLASASAGYVSGSFQRLHCAEVVAVQLETVI